MTNRKGVKPPDLLAFVQALSSAFSAAYRPEAEGLVERGLASLVHLLAVDRASLIEVDEGSGAVLITHNWAKIALPPAPGGDLRQVLPWYARRVAERQPTVLRTRDLPPEAVAEKAYCQARGFKAVATVPVQIGRSLTAAISVGSFQRSMIWPPLAPDHLTFVGEVLLHAVLRERALSRLGNEDPRSSLGSGVGTSSFGRPATLSLDDAMRHHIVSVLEACDWRIKGTGGAAECLGLAPSTLRFRMKKLGVGRGGPPWSGEHESISPSERP